MKQKVGKNVWRISSLKAFLSDSNVKLAQVSNFSQFEQVLKDLIRSINYSSQIKLQPELPQFLSSGYILSFDRIYIGENFNKKPLLLTSSQDFLLFSRLFGSRMPIRSSHEEILNCISPLTP